MEEKFEDTPMMKHISTIKKQNYFKWILTRWYFYILAILLYVLLDDGEAVYITESIGLFIGFLIVSFLIISFFVLIKKIIKKIMKKNR